MSELLEIRRLITKVNRAKEDLRREKVSMKNEVNTIRSWWKGNAATSFINRFSSYEYELLGLERKLDELKYNLSRLEDAIEDAEESHNAVVKNLKK